MLKLRQEKLFKQQLISISIEGIKKILFQMENCICKIYLKNNEIGIGFLCKIPFNNNLLPVLITNNHILQDLDNNKIIKVIINNKTNEIKIDNSRIKYISHDKNMDIAIIEIKPNKDKIYNYLELDIYDKFQNEVNLELEYKSIFIINYFNGILSSSYGLINEIIDNKIISHNCCTEEGLTGSPILSLKTFKVIGLHYGNSLNYGIFINDVIDELNNYKFKNEINLIYKNDEEEENIFGDKFVENNKKNIELKINGIKNKLLN